MANVTQIFVGVTVTIMMMGGTIGVSYLVTVILVRRFHTASNILTANVCFVSVLGGAGFYPHTLCDRSLLSNSFVETYSSAHILFIF
jgi:hypothetical protein